MQRLPRRVYEWMLRAIKLLSVYLRPRFRGMAHYARYCRRGLPLAEKTVLFEAYRAVKIADNPYAMFKAMVDDPYYADFTFVWAIDDDGNEYRRRYASRRNVRFCRIHSRAYAKALCTAKYLVNNKTWPFYFSKRPGQVHVTTWHATAFKALGKEQGGTIGQFKNLTRNLLHADYLVMPNRFTSEVMLRSNDVKGIFPGTVLEEGYPRVDLTINTPREEATALLGRVCGVDPAKKVVLYAPTWRGETGGYRDTTDVVVAHVRELREGLPEDHELVLKVHDLTYKHLASRTDLSGIRYVPDWVDTNELLAGVDVLVTDYSSIFFDFLVLDRPVVFFVYDLEDYDTGRGLYFDMDDMPGPLCHTAAEVAEAVTGADSWRPRFAETYAAMRAEYCGSEDGHAAQRVCDVVFKGSQAQSAYRSFDEGKARVLVSGCSFNHAARTFELIGLSRHLDHDVCDLTVLFTAKLTPERERLLRMLDPHTRVLYSPGRPALTPAEFWAHEAHLAKTAAERCSAGEVAGRAPYVERELHRLTGGTHYDVGVCFTDEANEGAYLVATGDFDRRVMWLADVAADPEKSMPGEFVAERFDRVFYAPGVEQSRTVRRIRALDKAAGRKKKASILREAERFVGFDGSVGVMLDEELRQAKRRILAATRRWSDAGCVSDEAGARDRLLSAAETGILKVAEALRACADQREESRGFDQKAHNAAIAEAFLGEVAARDKGEDGAAGA